MGHYERVQPHFETAGLTDNGLVRENNEDAVFVIDGETPNTFGASSFGLYLVADGMGGHRDGEVASDTAMRVISGHVLRSLTNGPASLSAGDLLRQAVGLAHRKILSMSSGKTGPRSMGTTVTVGLRLDLDLYLAHVGDSRAYLLREGKIRQLTEDHSVVAHLLKGQEITPRQAQTHPDRGKLLRSLGITADVVVDTSIRGTNSERLSLQEGDALVFCSDGLTDCLPDAGILKCVTGTDEAAAACRQLIEIANSRGGVDNTSVVIVKVR